MAKEYSVGAFHHTAIEINRGVNNASLHTDTFGTDGAFGRFRPTRRWFPRREVGVTLDAVRKLLLRKCKPYLSKDGRGFGLKGWCRAHGVASTHASDFLQGKRNPGSDLLEALGLEWRVMRKQR